MPWLLSLLGLAKDLLREIWKPRFGNAGLSRNRIRQAAQEEHGTPAEERLRPLEEEPASASEEDAIRLIRSKHSCFVDDCRAHKQPME